MTILKALVGSRAHGLNREDSDWDWRGIYVQPTREILSLGHQVKSIQWLEGREDFTNYEIGHFLMLATKANPSVLELLVSPTVELDGYDENDNFWGSRVEELLPYLYNPQDAYNAFTGYSLNQRKKLLDDKDGRKYKYALAYIRTLYNLRDLLETGKFKLEVTSPLRLLVLRAIRDGKKSPGEILDFAAALTLDCKKALVTAENKQDLKKVNDFLLEVRKAFW